MMEEVWCFPSVTRFPRWIAFLWTLLNSTLGGTTFRNTWWVLMICSGLKSNSRWRSVNYSFWFSLFMLADTYVIFVASGTGRRHQGWLFMLCSSSQLVDIMVLVSPLCILRVQRCLWRFCLCFLILVCEGNFICKFSFFNMFRSQHVHCCVLFDFLNSLVLYQFLPVPCVCHHRTGFAYNSSFFLPSTIRLCSGTSMSSWIFHSWETWWWVVRGVKVRRRKDLIIKSKHRHKIQEVRTGLERFGILGQGIWVVKRRRQSESLDPKSVTWWRAR